MIPDSVVKKARELMLVILKEGLTVRVGDELQIRPEAIELDRLVSEYGPALGTSAIKPSEYISGYVSTSAA